MSKAAENLGENKIKYSDFNTTESIDLNLSLPKCAAAKITESEVNINPQYGYRDYSDIPLKEDSENRPVWVTITGKIYLETFSCLYNQANDFLITISEPSSRPNYIHEYQITPYSLYAAVSVGLETDNIIEGLEKLSKVPIPQKLISFIRACTLSYGKVKLVLYHNRYWVETKDPDILQMILKDPIIKEIRKKYPINTLLSDNEANSNKKTPLKKKNVINDVFSLLEREEALEEDLIEQIYSFEIAQESVEVIKRRCIELDYPTLEEYGFRDDIINPTLNIHLKGTTVIRPYQEKSLSKMFSNGRARSGIIVLPCGAGKTLVGITAACTIRKATLILCTSAVAAEQWKQQFKHFTNIEDEKIARFTSDTKEKFSGDSGIIITTYTMVAYGGKRSIESQRMIEFIKNTEWGLLILDEVHVVPANVFRKVLITVAAHSKLGLTATLVREDEKITDLNFLIGPKLYEVNWLDLAAQGHIASVQCAEIWCPVTSEFYQEYLSESSRKRRLLYVMNPYKIQACQYLIKLHEAKGDKIIVFSDNVFALKAYARKLKKPFIYGPTTQVERMHILKQFCTNPNVNTIFLSKVGDTSIDLPEATCLIQISSHYGSRRQEAQRLGRILRAKRRSEEGFTAFFYSLVSKDTEEIYYSTKRQQFLIDQGYCFKVIKELEGLENLPDLVYSTKKEQLELLKSILVANDSDLSDDDVILRDDDIEYLKSMSPKKSNLSTASGANSQSYIEYNRSASGIAKARNPIFKSRGKPK